MNQLKCNATSAATKLLAGIRLNQTAGYGQTAMCAGDLGRRWISYPGEIEQSVHWTSLTVASLLSLATWQLGLVYGADLLDQIFRLVYDSHIASNRNGRAKRNRKYADQDDQARHGNRNRLSD